MKPKVLKRKPQPPSNPIQKQIEFKVPAPKKLKRIRDFESNEAEEDNRTFTNDEDFEKISIHTSDDDNDDFIDDGINLSDEDTSESSIDSKKYELLNEEEKKQVKDIVYSYEETIDPTYDSDETNLTTTTDDKEDTEPTEPLEPDELEDLLKKDDDTAEVVQYSDNDEVDSEEEEELAEYRKEQRLTKLSAEIREARRNALLEKQQQQKNIIPEEPIIIVSDDEEKQINTKKD